MPDSSRTPNCAEIRQSFINFFLERKHEHVPGSPLLPASSDSSLFFTNAGMNQFKPIFLGDCDPSSKMASLKSAVNSQNCMRAGGKHNDLDDVGKDSYHHVFFEMLGSWSFNDTYFKKEALQYAIDFLIKTCGLKLKQMYFTYHSGNEYIEPDQETKQILINMGIPNEKILPFDDKDNFWEMGLTGPCGPCCEIHYDLDETRSDASYLVNQDDPTLIEIWNIVFMQFLRKEPKGSLTPLPKKHIDTGMGLERLCMVIQGKTSTYDIDSFQVIFEIIEGISGKIKYKGKFGADDPDFIDMAFRVVADHSKALLFAIVDGILPNNTGRGRILRRAVRFGKEKLLFKPGDLSKVVAKIASHYKDIFPKVKENIDQVINVLEEEEHQFLITLDKGERVLSKAIKELKTNEMLDGITAWRLYDTFGFPKDLVQLICDEKGIKINESEYECARLKSLEVSKQKFIDYDEQKVKALVTLAPEELKELTTRAILTDDSFKYDYEYKTEKSIYYTKDVKSKVLAIKTSKGFHSSSESGETFSFISDKTNFYSEKGGQLADFGLITVISNKGETKGRFEVIECQVQSGYVLHCVRPLSEQDILKVSDTVEMKIDHERRTGLMLNHTGTHLLNFALRKFLPKADQRGSLVAPDKLRFDYSANSPLELEIVRRVEDLLNEIISQKLSVNMISKPLKQAYELPGLRTMFDEVYPDPCRIVYVDNIGVNDVNEVDGNLTSLEFCSGSHILNTEHIKHFVIMNEDSKSKGVRRLVAVTGDVALKIKEFERSVNENFNKLSKDVNSIKGSQNVEIHQLQKVTNELSLFLQDLKNQQISFSFRRSMNSALETKIKEMNQLKKQETEKFVKLLVNEFLQEIQGQQDQIPKCFKKEIESSVLGIKDLENLVKKLTQNKLVSEIQYVCIVCYNGLEKKVLFCLFSKNPEIYSATNWAKAISDNLKDSKSGGRPVMSNLQAFVDSELDFRTTFESCTNYLP